MRLYGCVVKPTSEPPFVPSEQARHTDSVDAPTDDDNAYLPFAQFVQTEAPVAFAYLPATQSMQVAIEVAPEVAEALPIPHKLHELMPIVS